MYTGHPFSYVGNKPVVNSSQSLMNIICSFILALTDWPVGLAVLLKGIIDI
jgi:hypothetical protein